MFTKLAQKLSQIEDVRLGFLNIRSFHICIKGEKTNSQYVRGFKYIQFAIDGKGYIRIEKTAYLWRSQL